MEAQLQAGQVPVNAVPLLLESVRHMQRCGQRRGVVTTSSERRKQRDRKGNKPQGHRRNGADAYTGAQRTAVPHAFPKVGDDCPDCAVAVTRWDRARP